MLALWAFNYSWPVALTAQTSAQSPECTAGSAVTALSATGAGQMMARATSLQLLLPLLAVGKALTSAFGVPTYLAALLAKSGGEFFGSAGVIAVAALQSSAVGSAPLRSAVAATTAMLARQAAGLHSFSSAMFSAVVLACQRSQLLTGVGVTATASLLASLVEGQRGRGGATAQVALAALVRILGRAAPSVAAVTSLLSRAKSSVVASAPVALLLPLAASGGMLLQATAFQFVNFMPLVTRAVAALRAWLPSLPYAYGRVSSREASRDGLALVENALTLVSAAEASSVVSTAEKAGGVVTTEEPL